MSGQAAQTDSPVDRLIRVVVIDDALHVRTILHVWLDSDPRTELVGEATNGGAGLALVATLAPDVVICDVQMPVLDGIATLREIKRQWPDIRVLMYSSDDSRWAEAEAAGAAAFFMKGTPFTDIIAAVVSDDEPAPPGAGRS